MAGESAAVAIETGQEVWQIFGALAAQRAAALNEVTKRCWRWRDAVSEILRETATELGSPAAALEEGVLFNSTQDTVVRFLPPFLLEEKHVDKGIRVLKKLLRKKRKVAA